jgi:hypothetical protein
MKRFITHALAAVTGALLASCWMTVAPKPVQSHAASFDQNAQNSGVIQADADGFIVTQHFLDRHKITDYTKAGQYFRITAQTMDIAVEQDAQRRQPQ